MATTHRMYLITTGGTIAGQVATDKLDEKMKKEASEFLGLIGPTTDYLNKKHDIEIDIKTHELCDVDSSDILPSHWSELAALIKSEYDNFDSCIITHGTNTLGYTCAALSFSIANPNKPIILTGSQVPAGLPGSDALTNLNNAMRVAVWRDDNIRSMKGILAVFGSHIITGTRVKKDTEFDYDAFKSFSSGSIGRIGRAIIVNEDNLEKHLSFLHTNRYPEAKNAGQLICENEFEAKIVSLTEFPGMSPAIFKELVDRCDVKGFIFRAFGAGDVSTHLREALVWLKQKEIPIVVTTQAPNGNSNLRVNAPGQYLAENKLAIPAYDMSIESQTTKLAWLLPKMMKKECTYEQLCEKMIENLRGEINIIWNEIF